MKYLNSINKLIFTGISIAALMSSSAVYAYSCERHIYNNSQKPWTVVNKAEKGNLHFSNGCPVNGPCTVAAGQTLEIRYTQAGGISRGRTTLTDYKGVPLSLPYSNSWKIKQCPTIESGRETAAVDVNRPVDGDYTINRDSWYE